MTAIQLTPRQRDFLTRVRNGIVLRLADREEDKTRQRCRRDGLAKVVMNPRRWVITEAGRRALENDE